MYDFTEIRPEKVDMLDLYPFSFREFLPQWMKKV